MNWLKLILDALREVPAVVKSLRQMPRPRKVEGTPLRHIDAEIQAKASREAGPPPRKPRTRYDD